MRRPDAGKSDLADFTATLGWNIRYERDEAIRSRGGDRRTVRRVEDRFVDERSRRGAALLPARIEALIPIGHTVICRPWQYPIGMLGADVICLSV